MTFSHVDMIDPIEVNIKGYFMNCSLDTNRFSVVIDNYIPFA